MDGHNVLFAIPFLENLVSAGDHEGARDRLRERCQGFAGSRGSRVVLVFDGVPGGLGGSSHGLVEVVFARHTEADDRIVVRAEREIRDGNRVRVVTRDQGLRRRLHGNAAAMGSLEFWQLSAPHAGKAPAEKPTVTDPDISAHFLAREGDDPPAIVRPHRVTHEGDSEYRRAVAEGLTGGGTDSDANALTGADGGADSGASTQPGTGGRTGSDANTRAGADGRTGSGAGVPPNQGGGRSLGSHMPFPTAASSKAPPPAPDPAKLRAAKKERGQRKQQKRLANRKNRPGKKRR